MRPRELDEKRCPTCGGTARFSARHEPRRGGVRAVDHADEPAASVQVPAWACADSECDYFEVFNDAKGG